MFACKCMFRGARALIVLELLCFSLLILLPAVAPAQISGSNDPFTRVQGPTDQDVPLPLPVQSLGQTDATARSAVLAYQQAAGTAGAQSWQSLSATGEMSYPPASDSSPAEADSATLTISSSGGYRLDVSRSDGVQSMRFEGIAGAIFDPGGGRRFLPRKTAAYGLLDFVLLSEQGFAGAGSSLLNRGAVSIGGRQLDRITYERPLLPVQPVRPDDVLVTDFYFDPTTHLLIKSAEMIFPPTNPGMGVRGPFLQVTTYGGYRQSGGMMLPSQFARTLNGELMWTLTLHQVSLNQAVSSSTFSLAGAQP